MSSTPETVSSSRDIFQEEKASLALIAKKQQKDKEKDKENEKIKILIRQQRENILKSKRDKEELLDVEGKKLIYPNQQDAAEAVLKKFANGATIVVLIAQPGIGKTGTAQAVAIAMATHSNDEKIIHAKNIINVTGMSDKDWMQQTKNSMLPEFRENILHRPTFVNNIKKKRMLDNFKDGLIIWDECHIASGKKMTMAKALKNSILDINNLKSRNIKILDVSATPDSVLADGKKLDGDCAFVIIEPGPSYKGFKEMLKEGRIIDAPNLEDKDRCAEFLSSSDKRYEKTTKKYHIFRIRDPEVVFNLEKCCKELDWDYKNHNSDERIYDIDLLMGTPPEKHTIIFVKGFWRASKRITRQHIGSTYEPIPKKRDVSVSSQSLVARDCDNYEYSGDQKNPDFRALHYCDKGALEQYMEWNYNDCDYNVSEYSSRSVSSDGKGKVISKPSKLDPVFVGAISNNINHEKEPIVMEFDTQEEVKDYFKKNIARILKKKSGRGPNKMKPNGDGFYEATIRSKKRVYSIEEIKIGKRQGLTEDNYRLCPCYEDIKNRETLKWLFIYY